MKQRHHPLQRPAVRQDRIATWPRCFCFGHPRLFPGRRPSRQSPPARKVRQQADAADTQVTCSLLILEGQRELLMAESRSSARATDNCLRASSSHITSAKGARHVADALTGKVRSKVEAPRRHLRTGRLPGVRRPSAPGCGPKVRATEHLRRPGTGVARCGSFTDACKRPNRQSQVVHRRLHVVRTYAPVSTCVNRERPQPHVNRPQPPAHPSAATCTSPVDTCTPTCTGTSVSRCVEREGRWRDTDDLIGPARPPTASGETPSTCRRFAIVSVWQIRRENCLGM